MRNILLSCLILIAAQFFAGCAAISIAEDENTGFTGPPAEIALSTASEFYKKRGETEYARKAVKALEASRNAANRTFEVEWTFAQYSYFLGSRKDVKNQEAEAVLKKGLAAALIAKRMKPERPEGHFWYAAILGQQSKRSPVMVGVVSVDKIREAMNKVIEIDPEYQGASAYDGLGQLEMGTRGLAGGSVVKAIEYFEKAKELDADNAYTRLHLGEAYLANGNKAQGIKQLKYVLDMTPNPDYIPEYEEAASEAKALLAKE